MKIGQIGTNRSGEMENKRLLRRVLRTKKHKHIRHWLRQSMTPACLDVPAGNEAGWMGGIAVVRPE
jgi:hypothetical protein